LGRWRLQTCGSQKLALRIEAKEVKVGPSNFYCSGQARMASAPGPGCGPSDLDCPCTPPCISVWTGATTWACGSELCANSPAGSRFCAVDGALSGAGDGNHPSGCCSVLHWTVSNSRAALLWRSTQLLAAAPLYAPYLRRMWMAVLPERRMPGNDAAAPGLLGDSDSLSRGGYSADLAHGCHNHVHYGVMRLSRSCPGP
jgi:hypothetical protein